MKTFLKTIGIFTIACSLPLSGYAGRIMTLKELNAFLEDLRAEGIKNLEPSREKIEKTKSVFGAEECACSEDFGGDLYKELPEDSEQDKKRKKELKETFLREHKKIPDQSNSYLGLNSGEADRVKIDALDALPGGFSSTVTKIEYNTDGEPISIEAINGFPYLIDTRLGELSSPFHPYIIKQRDPKATDERLEAFSQVLTSDDLKQRNIDVETLKTLGIKTVREITFDSILKSKIFTDEQKTKADEWLKDLDKLKKAIEDYAEAYPWVQKNISCTFKSRSIAAEKVLDWEKKTIRFKDKITEFPLTLSYLTSKLPDETSEVQKQIETFLKNLLPYKNGKEKVILLLLLDEMTPSEYRLKWMHDDGEHANGAYDLRGNAFYFSFEGKMKFLSHEIGHYLQVHLGLYQTFEDYQKPFAKKLLQLENNQTEAPIAVPQAIRDDIEFGSESAFWGLKNFCFKCPVQLTAKKFFEYLQLVTRWHSTMEISNILGIYFKNNTLYLNALSDIRELKRIRYTHGYRPGKEYMECNKDDFKEESDKALFEKITEEAFGKPVPTETLGLLCLLHRRPFEDAQNAVCDFDLSNGWKEWEGKVKPLISNFIKDEQ